MQRLKVVLDKITAARARLIASAKVSTIVNRGSIKYHLIFLQAASCEHGRPSNYGCCCLLAFSLLLSYLVLRTAPRTLAYLLRSTKNIDLLRALWLSESCCQCPAPVDPPTQLNVESPLPWRPRYKQTSVRSTINIYWYQQVIRYQVPGTRYVHTCTYIPSMYEVFIYCTSKHAEGWPHPISGVRIIPYV